jgi:S1-C subfamily serine protease
MTAWAIGSPQGDPLVVTRGIVSKITHFADVGTQIRIDTPIWFGNSGGPIIVEKQLVGIVSTMRFDSLQPGVYLPVPGGGNATSILNLRRKF